MRSDSGNDQWDACPAGTIQQLVDQQAIRRRRSQIAKIGSVCALLVVGVLVVQFTVLNKPRFKENHYGGISCTEVSRYLQAYHQGTVDAAMAEKIRLHLASCKFCADKFEEMKSSGNSVVASVTEIGTSKDP